MSDRLLGDARPLRDAGIRSLTIAALVIASPFLLAAICKKLDDAAGARALHVSYGDSQHANAKTAHLFFLRHRRTPGCDAVLDAKPMVLPNAEHASDRILQ